MTAPPAIAERAGYLDEVCRLLWPPPARAVTARGPAAGTGGGTGGGTEMIVLPGLRRPRLLVPAGRRASAAAVRRYGEPGSAATMLATRALAVLLAGGLGTVLRDRVRVTAPDGADTIGAHLSDLLGRRVEVSMHLGAARANRKPVLQLLTPSGETVAFAKIGVNDLTAGLIRAEGAALRQLAAAGLAHVRPPEVLAEGTWNGLEILVLSPLPTWVRRVPLTGDRLARAVVEVAQVAGTTSAPLAGAAYWGELAGRLARAAGDDADHDALRAALGRIEDLTGGTELRFGAWHGDLTPWNMAATRGALLVWDWERFTTGVPVGFDALHYWLQERVVPGKADPALAAAECVERAPELLGPFGMEPAAARLTALAYLADLSVRYLADRQAEVAPRLGAPGRWLIPALTTWTGRL